jgi:hypothetical protein
MKVFPALHLKSFPPVKMVITDNAKSRTKGKGMLEAASFVKA